MHAKMSNIIDAMKLLHQEEAKAKAAKSLLQTKSGAKGRGHITLKDETEVPRTTLRT